MREDLGTKALRIESCAKEAMQTVRGAIANTGIEKACYAVRLRVKPEARLVEKVGRKRETKPAYTIESITDVIGIRLITLFRRDLPEVVEQVLDLIDHKAELKPNPIKKDSLEEIILYNNEIDGSPFNLLIKETLDKRGVSFKTEHSKEGYSSLHIVCRLAPAVVSCEEIGPTYRLPIEIQIRTVFEDAWGEIDHKYGYVARSGKDVSLSGNQALIGPHLRVLKQFADACAAYADTIKEMAAGQGQAGMQSGKILSVESDDDVLRRFQQLGVTQKYIDLYSSGRTIRENCAAEHLEKRDRTDRYLEAAKYFEEVSKKCENELTGDALRLYWYYATLNFAFCLLSAGLPSSLESASRLYLDLNEKYPDFPLVKFRLGQAYTKLGRPDDALRLFEDAKSDVDKIAATSKTRGSWEDNLPLPDYNHISGMLPKLLGYQYWEKAALRTEQSSSEDRKALFRKAYEITTEGYQIKRGDLNLANNLAFYAIEYLSVDKEDEFAQRLMKDLPEYCTVIEKAHSEGTKDLFVLDTLLQIYIFRGQVSEAKNLCLILPSILASEEVPDTIARAIQGRILSVLTTM